MSEELADQVCNLVILCRRLIAQVKKYEEGNRVAKDCENYLRRKGYCGNAFRETGKNPAEKI
jgi:hypothetical protein